MGDWTFFYWAWLISWSPFVGTFIARVSKGRTLQEFIIGVVFVPAFASLIWIVIFGGTGIHFQHVEGINLTENIIAGVVTYIFYSILRFIYYNYAVHGD